jgi:hypothetical protein
MKMNPYVNGVRVVDPVDLVARYPMLGSVFKCFCEFSGLAAIIMDFLKVWMVTTASSV